MHNPKISVIVPVYNTEPYLCRCLDSIVNQTYKELEIILVDDGSSDKCGTICDEYAAKDNRVIVIHQENAGLSAARNTGLDAATGEYIGWVDSDDWIEPDMFQNLCQGILKNNADIAVCGYYSHYANGKTKTRLLKEDIDGSAQKVLHSILDGSNIHCCTWNKLFRASLFSNLRFPIGMAYEDVFLIPIVISKAKRIACLCDAKYHYEPMPGSITRSKKLINEIQRWLMVFERNEILKDDYPELKIPFQVRCMRCAISVWETAFISKKEARKKYRKDLEKIALFSKEHLSESMTYLKKICPGYKKIVIFFVWLTRFPFCWAFLLVRIGCVIGNMLFNL